jgi:hypothetical protein
MQTTTNGPEVASQLTGKAIETMTLWADAHQRVLRQLVDLSSGAATEGLKLYGDWQRTAVEAVREGQATALRWQSAWQDAPRDPLAWYQKAVTEGVNGTQKAFRYVEEQAQALTRAAERLQASAEQTGRQIQETVSGTMTKVKEIYGQG